MNESETDARLTIGDVASRAGVAEGTLRMWEMRYGFPAPQRLPSGHRRYTDADLAGVLAVLRARRAGLGLPSAIERARQLGSEPHPSVYGALRDRFEHLHPELLDKRSLLWLSRALEDECCSRAVRPILFACFQQERFYRQSETRWRDLARTAARAVVLADFDRPRKPRRGPAEVPIREPDPVAREWVFVCDAPEFSACLAGWERPRTPGQARRFETIWTVEPDVVREAARVFRDLVAACAPALVEDLRDLLADKPAPAGAQHLRAAVALATRVALYAREWPAGGLQRDGLRSSRSASGVQTTRPV
jgi:DICT domain-containing protein